MPRVLHIANTQFFVEHLLAGKLRGLSQAGYAIEVAAPRVQDPALPYPFHNLPIPRNLSPLGDIRALYETVRLLKSGRFDLVHTHSAKAGFIGRAGAWLCGLPSLHTAHGLPFYQGQPPLPRLLYRNLEDVRLLLTRVSRDRATGERLTEDPGGSGFSRFLNIATTIGMLFMGVMVVKYGDSLMPGRLTELLPHGAVLALSLLATLACAGVVLFQLATVRMAGAVTLSQPFISQVILLKRTYFTLAVIVTSPVLLLFALCPRGTGGVWFCIIVIELIVTAILYLREVLNLFISKKVSILHWILYLCIVEVFPVSLLWLLVAR